MAQNIPLRPPPFLQSQRQLNLMCAFSEQLTGRQVHTQSVSVCVCAWASTHKQWMMVRPSPSSHSSCHLSTCRISFRKERLDAGTSLCAAQPRYWNCLTIRYPSWGCEREKKQKQHVYKLTPFPHSFLRLLVGNLWCSSRKQNTMKARLAVICF